MERQVDPNKITLARESRGYTQKKLSEILCVSQGRVSRMERGALVVPDDLLARLIEKLKYPKEFFLEPTYIFKPISPFHRKRKRLPKKIQNQLEAEANIQHLHISKLLNAVEVPDHVLYQDLEELNITPQQAAIRLRQYWRLPRGPIENVTQCLEDAGIIVVHHDFGTALTDGFSMIVKDLPPMVFINSNTPGDRLRFTLAHELGHIVMHSIFTLEIEDEANAFAAEFLMPEDEIKPYLKNLSFKKFRKLADLKRYWGCSIASFIYQADVFGTIAKNQARYLWTQYRKMGYHRKEPIDIPIEKPYLMDELIDLHVNDLDYSVSEMCELLMCSQSDYRTLYKHKKLRLVS